MQIKELHNKEEISKTFAVIAETYEDLKEENYVAEILSLMQKDYKMAGVFEDTSNGEICIGAIGVKTGKKLQYGKILEIEDFAISATKIGNGVEKMLISWAEWQAANSNCNKIICTINTSKIESHKVLSRDNFILEGFKFLK